MSSITKDQKFRMSFQFVVSNSQDVYVKDYFGNEEIYGLNTSVFENLKNTVNLREISQSTAKNLHKKFVWDKYSLSEIKDIEVMIKIYDFFFMFSHKKVTDIVRSSIDKTFANNKKYNRDFFSNREINLINDLYDERKSQELLENLIDEALENVTDIGDMKRIQKVPTL